MKRKILNLLIKKREIMALHEIKAGKNDSIYDAYTQSASEKPLSKFKISESSNDPKNN